MSSLSNLYAISSSDSVDLTADSIAISDADYSLSTTSNATVDELGYLEGLSGDAQDQLDNHTGGLLVHSMTRMLSTSYTDRGVTTGNVPLDETAQSVYTESVLSTSGYGIYVPSGYYVMCRGFIKAYSDDGYLTFKIYRGSTAITSAYGGDVCASDNIGTNQTSGVEITAAYYETTGATFYLYQTGGTCDSIYNGNENIASTFLKIDAYKVI